MNNRFELDAEALEKDTFCLGQEIFEDVQARSIGTFSVDRYSERLMNWAMQNEAFKVSLLRFVDVFPSLETSSSVISHVQEYFSPLGSELPGALQKGLELSPDSLTAKVVARLIRSQIRQVAKRFIIGESPQSALAILKKIRRRGIAFTIDLLGEASLSESESFQYIKRYEELIRVLARETQNWTERSAIIQGHRGEQTPLNISIKLSALYSQTSPLSTQKSVQILSSRLGDIFELCAKNNIFAYVDMEDSSLTSITLESFKLALSRPSLQNWQHCGIVLQAYLRRTGDDLDSLIEWVNKRGTPIGIRLVKGAYWDTENLLSKLRGWPTPVWTNKQDTDYNYEQLTCKLLRNHRLIYPAFGSHNIRSLCYAISAAKQLEIPSTEFELQALFGMATPIKQVLAQRGFLLRDYCPIGEIIPGMGYLVRRLLENTSNESFLRLGFREHESPETLLKPPKAILRSDSSVENTGFVSCPLLDMSCRDIRDSLQRAITSRRSQYQSCPVDISPVIGGIKFDAFDGNSLQCISGTSVEDDNLTLSQVRYASTDIAELAIDSLAQAFSEWRETPVKERAEILITASEIMEANRQELIADIVLEVGKQWASADADVAEAVDFLRYYAREAERLGAYSPVFSFAGESNRYSYEARGIAAVISPWNFPLAIPCGMFASALVTGNCAILKPAEQSPLVAWRLFQIMLQAGLPPEVAAFLPGRGEEVGAYMVSHPAISTIAFTGSKDVGLQIIEASSSAERAATETHADIRGTHPASTKLTRHVKRVIAEMGGKNSIIVDEDADLDEAIKGVVVSAFGYQGQKCSACSRALVVGTTYERFVQRLTQAVSSLEVGPASDAANFMGAVIDNNAASRIWGIIDETKGSARLIVGGEPVADRGANYIPPTIFVDPSPDTPILTEEVFGPVLLVEHCASFEAAIESALSTPYALTGGLYSRSPMNIARAIQKFRVGNLYINRECTGALVGRQPFGGFAMSGVGSKAGGPDYLQQFMVPRVVSENTIRRGFAPEN